MGSFVSRYGLVAVLALFGGGKYVKMDSRVLIEQSPLLSWIYDFLSPQAVAYALGTTEIVTAILIACGLRLPRVSAAGSAIAVALFVCTLSFLFSTKGVVVTFAAGFFPVFSAQPGQFLLKDIVLIGVALWTLGQSLHAAGDAVRARVVEEAQHAA
ncbi:DUF417 family protein [Kutzneria kofuensis]|uniref:Putative membrane protein YkgB n=1 Tax=Kutzneria kofuensis TaxID=103725 RepID=A0A7W9NEK3_9PSEU|nr:putative membrane protein YkgB [Kutzneria kofuensis]